MTDRLSVNQSIAFAKQEDLESRYGKDAGAWRAASTTSILGGQFIEGMSKHANTQLQISSIQKRQNEIKGRADISVANILRSGEKTKAVQETAFAKAGVKLEGSALNVLTETAEQVGEAMRLKQREADFEQSQMEVAKEVARVNKKFSFVQTALSMGSTGMMAAGMGGK